MYRGRFSNMYPVTYVFRRNTPSGSSIGLCKYQTTLGMSISLCLRKYSTISATHWCSESTSFRCMKCTQQKLTRNERPSLTMLLRFTQSTFIAPLADHSQQTAASKVNRTELDMVDLLAPLSSSVYLTLKRVVLTLYLLLFPALVAA